MYEFGAPLHNIITVRRLRGVATLSAPGMAHSYNWWFRIRRRSVCIAALLSQYSRLHESTERTPAQPLPLTSTTITTVSSTVHNRLSPPKNLIKYNGNLIDFWNIFQTRNTNNVSWCVYLCPGAAYHQSPQGKWKAPPCYWVSCVYTMCVCHIGTFLFSLCIFNFHDCDQYVLLCA